MCSEFELNTFFWDVRFFESHKSTQFVFSHTTLQTLSYTRIKIFSPYRLLWSWNLWSSWLGDWLWYYWFRWLCWSLNWKWWTMWCGWSQNILLQWSTLCRVRNNLIARRERTWRITRERTTTNCVRLAPIECRSSYNIFYLYFFSEEHETKINR